MAVAGRAAEPECETADRGERGGFPPFFSHRVARGPMHRESHTHFTSPAHRDMAQGPTPKVNRSHSTHTASHKKRPPPTSLMRLECPHTHVSTNRSYRYNCTHRGAAARRTRERPGQLTPVSHAPTSHVVRYFGMALAPLGSRMYICSNAHGKHSRDAQVCSGLG